MKENINHSKHNLIAILVGFILIVSVTSLFFLKSSYLNNKKQQNSASEENQRINDDLKKYTSVNSSELLKKINGKDDFEVLDIRDQDSFLLGHIVDSKNISPEDLIKNTDLFDKNKQYYIVDDLGFTPSEKKVIDTLFETGFENVSYLEGGMYNWINQLNPIVEFGNPSSLADQSKVNYINSEELKKLIDEEGSTLAIVDVRKNSEYLNGHLKNATNIPLDDLESRRKEIPGYKRIILYDDTGIFAFQGASRLFDMGVLNVFALSDGLKSWKEKGFELVK